MANYSFDFKKILIALLPPFLRKPRTVAFLYSLISPMTSIHADLISSRAQYLVDVRKNSQQLLLQEQLNDKFDPTLRRFLVITPDATQLRTDAYLQGEGPKLLSYLQREFKLKTDAYALADVNFNLFNVEVSFDLINQVPAIKAYLNQYTSATKIYNLIWKG